LRLKSRSGEPTRVRLSSVPGRVLVVDDDEEIRETLCTVLQAEGYDAFEARNGLHALQQLLAQPLPDVILLDMMMPLMSGFEFLDMHREDPRIRDIPVIAVTAYAKVAEVVGVARLVRKPFDLNELLGALREVLDARPRS
jgi:two-component system chemotaxis response regulator CheY